MRKERPEWRSFLFCMVIAAVQCYDYCMDHRHSPIQNRHAFSLVELSIVLVIIGLLIGGVLAGQSLIRAAELRSLVTDVNNFTSAVQNFRDQYKALPGDMLNATNYWGAAHANAATCTSTIGTGTQTCNGTGDGFVSGPNGGNIDLNERFRFWQHLANAGFITGTYTGVSTPVNGNGTSLGNNVPKSRLANSGYSAYSEFSASSLANDFFNIDPPNNIIVAGAQATGSDTYLPNMSAAEAQNIDTKTDDGKPAYGKVQSFRLGSAAGPTCTTSTTATTANYALSLTGNICTLYFFFTR